MSMGFSLRSCALTRPEGKDQWKRLPIGIDHANDGIATPDGFQWGHKITHWFAVQLVDGVGAIQVMSWSRLAKALNYVDQIIPVRRDGYGEDDINYTGPLEPPLELPYELTWHDKRATYPPNSSFKGIPKLEHRIRLPEVLNVVNKPDMHSDYRPWGDDATTSKKYYRVFPPPRYLFEDERLEADLTFSSSSGEFVGQGHWSQVFRAKMEHPDITTQLKKKKSSPEGEPMQTDSPPVEEESNLPFRRYSGEFFQALLQYYITLVRSTYKSPLSLPSPGTVDTGSTFPMNLDPSLPDSSYESSLASAGEFGVPWWTIQEAYIKMRFQDSGVKTLKEVGDEKSQEMLKEIVGEIEEDARNEEANDRKEGKEDVEMKGGDGEAMDVEEKSDDKPMPKDKGKGKAKAESESESEDGEETEDAQEVVIGNDKETKEPKANSADNDPQKGCLLTFDPITRQFVGLARDEMLFSTIENEPDSLSERIHRSQQVMFFSTLNETHNEVVEKMIQDPKPVVLDGEDKKVAIDPSKVIPAKAKANAKESGSNSSQKTPTKGQTSQKGASQKEEEEESLPESEWETRRLPFTLLAKLPSTSNEAHRMILREGYNYSLFPEHLMEARQGYIQTKPMQMPQPAQAVVPRFFGLYKSCTKRRYRKVKVTRRVPIKKEKAEGEEGEEKSKEEGDEEGEKMDKGDGEGGEGDEGEGGEGEGDEGGEDEGGEEGNEKVEDVEMKEVEGEGEGDMKKVGDEVTKKVGKGSKTGDKKKEEVEYEEVEEEVEEEIRQRGFIKRGKFEPGEYILLMEECGTQVSETSLKPTFRNQIMSMSVRLHRFGMLQNSPYVRNVVVQPGPLTLPPSSRTLSCPSFRIIDFGRGEHYLENERNMHFYSEVDYEEKHLAEDLGFLGYQAAGRIWPDDSKVEKRRGREEEEL